LIDASSNHHDISWLSARITALAGLAFLNDPSNLESVLNRIAEIAQILLPATGGASIILWNPETETFTDSTSTIKNQKSKELTRNIRKEGGATRWIVDNHKPFLVSDIKHDPFGANPMLIANKLQSYAGFPILSKNEAIGVIYVLDQMPRSYSEQDLEFMKILSDRAANAIVNARLYAQLERLATVDELTGTYNRRGFLKRATQELRRANRFGNPLSALLIDVDDFKLINDRFRHKVGDQILKEITLRLQQGCREVDILGRVGGEEFAILLVESQAADAYDVAERLRKQIVSEPIPIGERAIEVTISVGVASFSEATPDVETLLDLADVALYRAKRQGKNRVVLW
jgi:diguanylate cyclase (GGDEF)-like protein